jgi:hypothetical protein
MTDRKHRTIGPWPRTGNSNASSPLIHHDSANAVVAEALIELSAELVETAETLVARPNSQY